MIADYSARKVLSYGEKIANIGPVHPEIFDEIRRTTGANLGLKRARMRLGVAGLCLDPLGELQCSSRSLSRNWRVPTSKLSLIHI